MSERTQSMALLRAAEEPQQGRPWGAGRGWAVFNRRLEQQTALPSWEGNWVNSEKAGNSLKGAEGEFGKRSSDVLLRRDSMARSHIKVFLFKKTERQG